jgi:hypothetical protein
VLAHDRGGKGKMKEGKNFCLTRCVDCNEIISLSTHDFSPEYFYDAEKDVLKAEKRDDRKEFEGKHQRHHLEELQVIEESFISEGLYLEPVKTSYFEVTNGCEKFVVKKWRKDVYTPLTYELIPGHLVLTKVSFSAQGEGIRKQLHAEVKLTDRADEKAERFVNVVQSVISQMDEKDLDRENLCETGDPALSHAILSEDKVGKIVERCREIFAPDELKKIEKFIRENNEYNGVMTALVKRYFEIRMDENRGVGKGTRFPEG